MVFWMVNGDKKNQQMQWLQKCKIKKEQFRDWTCGKIEITKSEFQKKLVAILLVRFNISKVCSFS